MKLAILQLGFLHELCLISEYFLETWKGMVGVREVESVVVNNSFSIQKRLLHVSLKLTIILAFEL